MMADSIGAPIRVPVIVARGAYPGPTVGITAAVHGNELNGIRIIHRLFADLDPDQMRGTVVAVPVVNVPGFARNTRAFADGVDINRVMPGRPHGPSSEVFAYRFVERIVRKFDYLIDLHTASFGRINSLYVRADLTHPETSWMARAQHPQIIVHNQGQGQTLRGAAMALGIPAITVEVGDPHRFQKKMIRFGMIGVGNVLARLKVLELDEELPEHEPIVCSRSHWLYSDEGGLLEVFPELTEEVIAGQMVGRITNIFGDVVTRYFAPEAGIVVGKSVNPVSPTGSRILHLGILGEPEAAIEADDE
ncbi:MAG: succinylglutamate desuccinylase/aspartoacylase family protein [Myxococcales bacterium]|nr:succinylglutamate desuccinylase/aspartoacylase family protein [Myxococcales bacterium]MCB9701504.1 succinylglutamate desuccinylase/aspartoacylase family protein [Myxococcales bacterium]